jgi:hypothetical protein
LICAIAAPGIRPARLKRASAGEEQQEEASVTAANPALVDDQVTPEQELARKEMAACIRKGIAQLAEGYQTVLVLGGWVVSRMMKSPPAFYRYRGVYPRRNGSPQNCSSRAGDERNAAPVCV